MQSMKEYPRLKEMGVRNPGQIDRYAVNSIDYTDVLRIVYVRPKGSVLPETRTYKFPRVQKSVPLKGSDGNSEVVMESAPCLREALEELADLMASRKQKTDVASAILEELRVLEEEIASRAESIRQQVSRMKTE